MIQKDCPLVTIQCLTYNHEPYIRQCLEGFVMQQTDFCFEAIVHDDASTDGTADIIREYAEKYPDIIKPIYETENQYSKHDGSLDRIMNVHMHGKYVAFCEGDDYWIDPLKLQKQVDFLEVHQDYKMSHTSFKYYYEYDDRYFDSKDVLINPNYSTMLPERVLWGYRVQTLTVLLRRDMLEKAKKSDDFLFSSGYFLMGDTQLWYTLASMGKVHFLPEQTAVYRANQGSATRSNLVKNVYRFRLSSFEMRMYLYQRDSLSEAFKKYVSVNYDRALYRYLCYDKSFMPLYDFNNINNLSSLIFLKNIGVLKIWLNFLVQYRNVLGRISRFMKTKL